MKKLFNVAVFPWMLFAVLFMAMPNQEILSADEGNSDGISQGTPVFSNDESYWFEKGALYATYGNQDAAIEAFEKVIELDPGNSEAYFNIGIAYGEKGEFEKAIDAVNKAIYAQPENGRFYYGRGWLHQLSGNKEKAKEDISKAAELGNEEAKTYLENVFSRQSI